MDLKEIVNRPNETPIEEQEAYLVIKEYIKARKGVEIQPMIETRLGKLNAMHEVNLMHQMLNYAIGWFRQNPNAL
jgi:hypothetical protein